VGRLPVWKAGYCGAVGGKQTAPGPVVGGRTRWEGCLCGRQDIVELWEGSSTVWVCDTRQDRVGQGGEVLTNTELELAQGLDEGHGLDIPCRESKGHATREVQKQGQGSKDMGQGHSSKLFPHRQSPIRPPPERQRPLPSMR